MTQPVQEVSPERMLQSAVWRTSQLARRPPIIPVTALCANLHIKVVADDDTVLTGDGQFIEAIAENMSTLYLTGVEIFITTVSSSGIVQVQIRNRTQGVDMLVPPIQIDQGELNSADASVQYFIDETFAQVFWEDEICIDVDQAGVGAKGLGVHLEFCELPNLETST